MLRTGQSIYKLNNISYNFRLVINGGLNNSISNAVKTINNFKSTNINSTSVDFVWTKMYSEDVINIYQSIDNGITWTKSITSKVIESDDISSTVIDLDPITNYKFKLVLNKRLTLSYKRL